jgi:alkaline phosphatase D
MKHLAGIMIVLYLFSAVYAQTETYDRILLDPAYEPFYHGVASGDPLPDRVIIWTRITTANSSENIDWEMATDKNFSSIVNSGTVVTDSSKDYTVKVDVNGLQPNTWYYYRFKGHGVYSITGRTRTAPASAVNNLRFAVVSC